MTLSLKDELAKCVWWAKMVKEVGPQIKEKAPLYCSGGCAHICYPPVSDHIGTEVWRKWSYPFDWPDALVKIKAAAKIQKQYREHLYGNLSDGEDIHNSKKEDDWIIAPKTLLKYEREQLPEEPTKEFLKRL